jgi:hypothetical protein
MIETKRTDRHALALGTQVELRNGSRVFITAYGKSEVDGYPLYGVGILKISTDIVGYTAQDFKPVTTRTVALALEIDLHKRLAKLFSGKMQGQIMGAFREALEAVTAAGDKYE